VTVRFSLPNRSRTVLQVFDRSGRRLARILEGSVPAGSHEAFWDGRDEAGRRMPSGVYLLSLNTTELADTRAFLLLR
jgi:flagellar hook assembly protein FlgD